MTLHSQRFATETLIRLSEKIPNIEIILEYSIKPYRVDAYLPDHNISIEIDENDHAVYDPDKEVERSRYITNTLHCSWIRVNNSDSIENTVEQLLKQLKYYGISPATIVPQELIKESQLPNGNERKRQLPNGNTLQNKSYVQQLREFKAQQAEEAAKLELERLQQKSRPLMTTTVQDVIDLFVEPADKETFLSVKDLSDLVGFVGRNINKLSDVLAGKQIQQLADMGILKYEDHFKRVRSAEWRAFTNSIIEKFKTERALKKTNGSVSRGFNGLKLKYYATFDKETEHNNTNANAATDII